MKKGVRDGIGDFLYICRYTGGINGIIYIKLATLYLVLGYTTGLDLFWLYAFFPSLSIWIFWILQIPGLQCRIGGLGRLRFLTEFGLSSFVYVTLKVTPPIALG